MVQESMLGDGSVLSNQELTIAQGVVLVMRKS